LREVALVSRVAGGVGVGVLPTIDPLVALAFGVAPTGGRVELALAHAFAHAADRTGPSGRIGAWLGQLRGCGEPRVARVTVPLCLGAELGGVVARGIRVETSRRRSGLMVALVAAPGIVFRPLPRLGLWASAEGFVVVRRPGFALADGTVVHRTARAGARLLVGLELRVIVIVRTATRERLRRRR
jgi:hypothetical protein